MYMGWALGTATKEARWATAIAKYRARIAALVETSAPVHILARLYNCYVAPVLTYLPCFGEPPSSLWGMERSALHSIMRWPQNAAPRAAFAHLRAMRGPFLRQLEPMIWATALNFAVSIEQCLVGMRNNIA